MIEKFKEENKEILQDFSCDDIKSIFDFFSSKKYNGIPKKLKNLSDDEYLVLKKSVGKLLEDHASVNKKKKEAGNKLFNIILDKIKELL